MHTFSDKLTLSQGHLAITLKYVSSYFSLASLEKVLPILETQQKLSLCADILLERGENIGGDKEARAEFL